MKRIVAVVVVGIALFIVGCDNSNPSDEDNNPPSGESFFPVVIEEFSHTDCVPCVNVAEAVQTVIENYAEQGAVPVFIEFHPKPEGFGADPFHDENPDLHDGRMAWYFDYFGLENLPQLLIDAQPLSAMERNDPDVIQQRVEDARGVDKVVRVNGEATSDGDSIHLTLTLTADSTISEGNADIFCFLVRREVEFSEAPGSNGLSEFHMVATRIFPVDVATAEWDSISVNSAVPVPPEIDGATTSGFGVVVIVQDTTRTILGTGYFDVEESEL